MALKISGTTVVDNNKAITNVTSYSGPGVASQSEAEAGTNNDQLMTPLRVKQAIEAMAGSNYPDISTDGWPGTDKGHAGFGAFCTNPNNTNDGSNTVIMPFGSIYDPNRLQDLVTRNSPSWEHNRTANKSTTKLKPVTGPLLFQTVSYPTADQINIIFPNPIGSKTLDIYMQTRYSYIYNDTAAQNVQLRWASGMTDSTVSTVPNTVSVTFSRSRVYDGDGTNYRGATYRYRVTNAPESTRLMMYGYQSTYSQAKIHLCYYEVY